MTDLEIARSVPIVNIKDIARKIGLTDDDLVLYGSKMAKINRVYKDKVGKLILVTAINPTPYGEGKTTVSIGLGDALNSIGKRVCITLRQPSMGPVFGIKGGATGGGRSQIIPVEDINLHFTGDFHAITSANNLLSAAIDNHIFHGNELDIQKVIFNRCMDVNDRALRNIAISGRDDSFCITAASEIMALFCLADSLDDLKNRLSNIVIGYNSKGEMIYAKDLNIQGALTVILKDAFKPNLVQTLEHTPVILHGGPFANIAHGCNSVVATKLALSFSDYVVTEAGFGADLGAEKFFDIKCRMADLKPDCVVLVATVKALKYNGKNNELIDGLSNLKRHIENLRKYGVNIVVCLNKYAADTDFEIKTVVDYCNKMNVCCEVSSSYVDGGTGAISLASKVVELCDSSSNFKLLYKDNESIRNKIRTICCEIYRATDVTYSDLANKKIDYLEQNNIRNFPICVAKTQYSFSDNAKKLGAPVDFIVHVRDVQLYNGAGFITIFLGNIMTMPGLPAKPNYGHIDFVDGKIIGIS